MQYQDGKQAPQAADDPQSRRLTEANINPITGLATDYLNHFNEAIMLLEMLPGCPDCRDDLLAWRPKSYVEHFVTSSFKDRELAVAAYEAADPKARETLDLLTRTMTGVVETARSSLDGSLPAETVAALAASAVAWLKPAVARAGAVINGFADGEPPAPQATVDRLMRR